MENKFCPCCGRHCSLSAPHCGRGEEYARTGVIPTRENSAENGNKTHAHSHGEHGCHAHGDGFHGEHCGHGHRHHHGCHSEGCHEHGEGHGHCHGHGEDCRRNVDDSDEQ